MLVLSRRLNEKLLFPDIGTAVQVLSVKGSTVRLGIEAPPEVTVLREEIPHLRAEWAGVAPASDPANQNSRDLLARLFDSRLRVAGSPVARDLVGGFRRVGSNSSPKVSKLR